MDKDRKYGVPFVYENKRALAEHEALQFDREMKNTMFSLVHKSLAAENDFCPADGHSNV